MCLLAPGCPWSLHGGTPFVFLFIIFFGRKYCIWAQGLARTSHFTSGLQFVGEDTHKASGGQGAFLGNSGSEWQGRAGIFCLDLPVMWLGLCLWLCAPLMSCFPHCNCCSCQFFCHITLLFPAFTTNSHTLFVIYLFWFSPLEYKLLRKQDFFVLAHTFSSST